LKVFADSVGFPLDTFFMVLLRYFPYWKSLKCCDEAAPSPGDQLATTGERLRQSGRNRAAVGH
jgi:hypothetical protein